MIGRIERYGVCLCANLIALLMLASAWGRDSEPRGATVRTDGQHEITLAPQKIRLQLVAKAEGSNANEAVAALARHKRRVREELLALNAVAQSVQMIDVATERHTMGVPKEYGRLSTKALAEMLDGSVNGNIDDLPVVFTATCIIEADWMLPESDDDMLLQAPTEILKQVAQRDLSGEENRLELSPEKQGQVEAFVTAFTGLVGHYPDADGHAENRRVLYVATVSPEARTQALKAAFEQARSECAALAEASGHKLGRMVSLVKVPPSEYSEDWLMSSASDGTSELLLARDVRAMARYEFVAPRPDLLNAKFRVRATFEIDP